MKSKLLICMLLLSSISFVSCSSDDSAPNNSTSQFKDKWWYSPDSSTLDLYFNSNGTYQSTFFFNGTNMNSDGEWQWVNESAKTIHVFNLQGNATNEFYAKVITLTAHTMTIKMSLDGGATYTQEVPYVDAND